VFDRFRSTLPIERLLLRPSFGERLQTAFDRFGQLGVGIDPSSEQLIHWDLPDSTSGLSEYGEIMLEGCVGRVGIIKPQVAFYERFGAKGFTVLEKLCLSATQAGLMVIADAKRGDIGSTMDGYAKAWLGTDAPFVVDALTLSPYLGPQTLENVINIATQNQRGVFILAATSNPEAKDLQQAAIAEKTVSGSIADFAISHNGSPMGAVGLVIGATVKPREFGINLELLANTPILAPGFGFQGAKLSDLAELFGPCARTTIANVGRSVTSGGRSALVQNIEKSKSELLEGLSR